MRQPERNRARAIPRREEKRSRRGSDQAKMVWERARLRRGEVSDFREWVESGELESESGLELE